MTKKQLITGMSQNLAWNEIKTDAEKEAELAENLRPLPKLDESLVKLQLMKDLLLKSLKNF